MTITNLSRSGIHPRDRCKSWVTSTENRPCVGWFGAPPIAIGLHF